MGREVLLVNTNRIRPAVGPIGLDYTADVLRERGIGVRLLDLCFEEDVENAAREALGGSEPLLVGLTLRNTDDCYLASGEDFVPGFAGIVESVRRHTEAPLVIGGGGYSIFPEAILRVSGADFGVAGDGEVALAELAGALAAGGEVGEVPGLVWMEAGEVRRNAPWLGDISELPRRARGLIDNERYFAEGGQAGVETKRGCDRKCIYCADPVGKGRRVRMRSPEQVADEFETLLARGIDHFHLCDSEFNVPERHARACARTLSERGMGATARWYGYGKAPIGTALAAEMRAAGCVGMNFGADSGDDEMLARLGRDFRVDDLEETANACRSAGIRFMYDLLLGGPGETRETAARTIEVMKRISPDRVGVSLGVQIYPGTRLAEMVRSEGPMERNPNLQGAVENNPDFLRPVFYLSAALGEDAAGYVASLVGGDQRFFFPTADAGTEAYNYSDSERLVNAIKAGHRGAYWDILRRLAEGQ